MEVDEITLKKGDLLRLQSMLSEMPYKFALPIMQLLGGAANRQLMEGVHPKSADTAIVPSQEKPEMPAMNGAGKKKSRAEAKPA